MKVDIPDIYTYDDYRRYIQDWVTAKSAAGVFSLRWFSRRAGFHSHNLLQLVVNGKRNLTRESGRKFSIGLGHTDREAEYFADLIGMNQAKTHEERVYYYERLVRHPERRKVRPMEQAQLAFFQNWLAPVVYEMIRFPDFKPDAEWVAAQIEPEPAPAEIRKILDDLPRSGLVEITPEGKWLQREPQIHSGDDVRSVHLRSYHEQALTKANDALVSVPAAQRHFHVLTTAVANELLPVLVELTQKYEAEVWRIVETSPLPKDQVVQVGLHIFPSVRISAAPALRVPRRRGKKGAR